MTQRFDKIVGVGGIGTGLLFHTDGGRTLGRSESRLVTLSGAKDYCKLHIVFYYAAALLAPRAAVIPVGFVGDDSPGRALREEMRAAGMDVSQVRAAGDAPTTVSVCLQYPDKETCNFTAQNGACGLLTPEHVREAARTLVLDGRTVAAALPEVSPESRIALLRLGREAGAFCVLSIPEAEAGVLGTPEVLAMTDLLAVNEAEAQALTKSGERGLALAKRLYAMAAAHAPALMLAVTCGGRGAYTVTEAGAEFVPPFPVEAVVNTTGAGDAFLGGTIAGLSLGLPFQKGREDASFGASPLKSAPELGALCAGLAVETADSIAYAVTRETISVRAPGLLP